MYAIYERGKCGLQTTVDSLDGICHFTNKTVGEYLKELGSNFSCLPLEDALSLIHEAENINFINQWEEINVDDYHYWLGVLPPQKWQTVDGVNLFRISEHLTGNITLHCAVYNGKYFSAYRRTSDSYKSLAAQIKNL